MIKISNSIVNIPLGALLLPFIIIVSIIIIVLIIRGLRNVSVKGSKIVLTVYNLLIVLTLIWMGSTSDTTGFGDAVLGIINFIIFAFVLIFTPILEIIIYRNVEKSIRAKRILMGYVWTIITTIISIVISVLIFNWR